MNNEKYKAAIDTLKHYDTVSVGVIGGIFGVPLFALSKTSAFPNKWELFVFMAASSFLVYCLWQIYIKLAFFAAIARHLSARHEQSDCLMGISQAYVGTSDALLSFRNEVEIAFTKSKIKFWVGLATTILIALMLIRGSWGLCAA